MSVVFKPNLNEMLFMKSLGNMENKKLSTEKAQKLLFRRVRRQKHKHSIVMHCWEEWMVLHLILRSLLLNNSDFGLETLSLKI